MAGFWKWTIVIGAINALVLVGGYAIDHHRCKRINYEQAAYDLPTTWFIDANQCLAVANTIRMRHYARTVTPSKAADREGP